MSFEKDLMVGMSLQESVEMAVATLQMYAPKTGEAYYVGYSGGKDSCVVSHLCTLAEVRHELHHCLTGIDAPELVRFVRGSKKPVIYHAPKTPFFLDMPKKGFPSRRIRWCCKSLKESSTPEGCTAVFGIRASESKRRETQWPAIASIRQAENGGRYTCINPILYWTDEMVWDFITKYEVPYCSLYDSGYKRLGCVGCPQSYRRASEIAAYPRFQRAWKRSLQIWWKRQLERPSSFGNTRFQGSFDAFWEWYWSNDPLPEKEECGSTCMGAGLS